MIKSILSSYTQVDHLIFTLTNIITLIHILQEKKFNQRNLKRS